MTTISTAKRLECVGVGAICLCPNDFTLCREIERAAKPIVAERATLLHLAHRVEVGASEAIRVQTVGARHLLDEPSIQWSARSDTLELLDGNSEIGSRSLELCMRAAVELVKRAHGAYLVARP
jgi:hypothetical protein